MEQVPNIESFDTIFEPINSPEYNEYCKEVGLVVSYVGGKFCLYVEPSGAMVTLVHHPLFDGEKPLPFRLNKNYEDPRDRTARVFAERVKNGEFKVVYLNDEK